MGFARACRRLQSKGRLVRPQETPPPHAPRTPQIYHPHYSPDGIRVNLKVLHIHSTPLEDSTFVQLSHLMDAGAVAVLEDLWVVDTYPAATIMGFHALLKPLIHGKCSQLRSLRINGVFDLKTSSSSEEAGDLIHDLLVFGCVPLLQTLTLKDVHLGYEGAPAALAALGNSDLCPHLSYLDVSGSTFRADAELENSLLELLVYRSLSYRKGLHTLHLNLPRQRSQLYLPEQPLAPFLASMPALSSIQYDYHEKSFNYQPFDTLAGILKSCKQLTGLHIHGYKGVLIPALSLCQDRLQVTELDLSSSDRSYVHGILLGKALGQGVLPMLEVLNLGGNRKLGEGEGIVKIMGALRDGKCPYIKVLDLRGIIISGAGGAALGNALRSEHFAHLETLSLVDVTLEPKGATSVLTAIKDGACPALKTLNLAHATWFDSTHLLLLAQAVTARHLTRLEVLDIITKEPMDNDAVGPLAWALGNGGCPRLRELSVAMGREGTAILMLNRMLGFGHLARLCIINISILVKARTPASHPNRVDKVQSLLRDSYCPSLVSFTITYTSERR